MEKLLVVLGSPRYENESVSTQATKYFVDMYTEGKEVQVDVIKVSEVTNILLTETILAGKPTEADMKILAKREQLLNLFIAADKIVLGIPMWNFGLPGMTKEVIDTFAVAGKTFKYLPAPDENGNIFKALVDPKKLLLITAAGGIHKNLGTDMIVPQIKILFHFIGTTDVIHVAAEGVSIPGMDALGVAKQELAEVAKIF